MEQNAANERIEEAELEDKTIETLFPGLKRTQLEDLLNLEEGSDVEDAAPQLYFLLANNNKKKWQTKLSIVQQDVDDFTTELGGKTSTIPFGCV